MTLQDFEYQAAADLIESSQNIVVVPHANVDPDGLGSALACCDVFTKLGKNITVICPDTKPENLSFLPGFDQLHESIETDDNYVITINLRDGVEIDKLRYSVEDNRVNIIVTPKNGSIETDNILLNDITSKFDLLCIVDTAELHLLGSFKTDNESLFTQLPILNIDHHTSNPRFGTVQLIDTKAASATEVLYRFFMSQPEWHQHISADTATLLLTGLITDTRSFQNPNTTPESLEVAAELLEKGARQQEIIQHIYKTKPLSTLKIWGRALHKIQIDAKARIVWSSVSKEDLLEIGAKSKETHGILDELISTIPDADVHILFTELENGGLKASARSSERVNISEIVHTLYGGGGHDRAAGFKLSDYDNFQVVVIDAVRQIAEAMKPGTTENNSNDSAKNQEDSNNQGGNNQVSSKEYSTPDDQPIDILKTLESTSAKDSDQ